MDTVDLVKFIAAFLFVLGLMGGLALVMRKLNAQGIGLKKALGVANRLEIVEVLPLDPRRRAVLIRRDHHEHLVILGPSGETVVETNIPIKEEKTT